VAKTVLAPALRADARVLPITRHRQRGTIHRWLDVLGEPLGQVVPHLPDPSDLFRLVDQVPALVGVVRQVV
jgi:hypothetical protein